MATAFHLQIATPDGSVFDGQATRLICRSIDGDLCIMAKHTNYCTALGMGTAKVTTEDGTVRTAACIGGMLSVMNGECRVTPTTWEWKEDIDLNRAERAKERAEKKLAADRDKMNNRELMLAEAKLKRALIRSDVAKLK